MELYSETENYKLYHGDMNDLNAVIPDGSIDCIVTDPPYELGFMGKSWDASGVAFRKETWKHCYDVLKPGGYLLAFGGSRTFHRIACAVEDAGFEIRDVIMWLYGTGFPKSMNIGKAVEAKITHGSANTQEFKHLQGKKEIAGGWGLNKFSADYGHRPRDYTMDGHQRTVEVEYQSEEGKQWDGWGTALKPSYEPIIVARKPFDGSCTDNVLTYGVGGLNIDECRIGDEVIKGGTAPDFRDIGEKSKKEIGVDKLSFGQVRNAKRIAYEDHTGRYPANTILTYDDTDYDEVCGGFPDGGKNGSISKPYKMNNRVYGDYGYCNTWQAYDDEGSASRYFYCAKASTRDRDEGLEAFDTTQCVGGGGGIGDYLLDVNSCSGKFGSEKAPHKNNHPTVKPTSLLQYLIRLVAPSGATILDPFMGSGSTGKAAMYENKDRQKGYKFIGIELTGEYLPVAQARINYAIGNDMPVQYKPVKKKTDQKQVTMWDV